MKTSEVKYEKKYIEIRINEDEAQEILIDLKECEDNLELEPSTEWLIKYLKKLTEEHKEKEKDNSSQYMFDQFDLLQEVVDWQADFKVYGKTPLENRANELIRQLHKRL